MAIRERLTGSGGRKKIFKKEIRSGTILGGAC